MSPQKTVGVFRMFSMKTLKRAEECLSIFYHIRKRMKPLSVKESNDVFKAIPEVVKHVVSGARKATKYLSPTLTVKATRQHPVDRRNRSDTIVLSIGKPNYQERDFIRVAKLAKEKFPISKVQLKWYKKND